MNRKTSLRLSLVPLAVAALVSLAIPALAATAARGAGASIEIATPLDGAQLDAGETYPLQYAVVPGGEGDHFHVWVDADRGPGVHTLKGSYDLPKMTPGTHVITVRVVDKGHVPTGPEKSIKVVVK